MQVTAIDLASKIIIPICTFGLGVSSTLFLKRSEIKRQLFAEHIKALRQETNDWYNQLLDLRALAIKAPKDDSTELKHAVFQYVANRLQLPKLLESLEIVRADKRYIPLVGAVEEFLSVVTNYKAPQRGKYLPERPIEYPEGVACKDVFMQGNQDELFDQLDMALQNVTRLSANALVINSRYF